MSSMKNVFFLESLIKRIAFLIASFVAVRGLSLIDIAKDDGVEVSIVRIQPHLSASSYGTMSVCRHCPTGVNSPSGAMQQPYDFVDSMHSIYTIGSACQQKCYILSGNIDFCPTFCNMLYCDYSHD